MDSDDIDFEGLSEDLLQFQEDEMVQQALQRGVDLKRYGAELEKELKLAEAESVGQYVENSPQVVDLHKQMLECDAVLARMQSMLLGFQADLGGISEEIKHLQDESLSMSIRLKNRKAAEERLRKFVDNSSISPDMAANITSATVNDAFLESVDQLTKKLKYLQQQYPPKDGSSLDIAPADTFAGRSMLPELEKLKLLALTKAKDYFAAQINAIRKPKTNVQVLQQMALVKYAPLFRFLQIEVPSIADELRALYIESMGRTLHNLFKAYYNQLLKLDLVMAGKGDLVAVDDAALKSVFTQKVNMTKRGETFALAGREKVLDEIESEPVLLHVAVAEGQRYPYEAILRSIIKHLIDAATNEFLFVLDFFKTSSRDTFNKIFGRTLSLLLENLENYLLNCNDAVGLLLMIKVTHSMRMIMQRRRIPVLDSLFDRISMLLWPRLKAVLDANIRSVRTANAKKLGAVDLTPHYVCKRYAELVSSIFVLQVQQVTSGGGGGGGGGIGGALLASEQLGVGGGGENMLTNDLQSLRTELVGLLERLSASLAHSKERRVFFINNYDSILSVFQERRIMCDEVQRVEDLLMQQRELFAEEAIRGSFPSLISFVVQTEQAINDRAKEGGVGGLTLDEAIVEGLVRFFPLSSAWSKSSVDSHSLPSPPLPSSRCGTLPPTGRPAFRT